jgi:hypothetical protein
MAAGIPGGRRRLAAVLAAAVAGASRPTVEDEGAASPRRSGP